MTHQQNILISQKKTKDILMMKMVSKSILV